MTEYIKTIPHITTDPDEFFTASLKTDRIFINSRIMKYNQERDSKTQSTANTRAILFELYEYYKFVLQKYSQIDVNSCAEFTISIQRTLYEDIQREFMLHNINSLEPSTLENHDLESNNLTQLPGASWEQMIEQDLPLKVPEKVFIRKMATEDNPEKMYLELMQLKRMIRIHIAKTYILPTNLPPLRNLICAINTKIIQLKDHPDNKNKIAPLLIKPSEFSEYLANMDPDLLSRFTEKLLAFSNIKSPQTVSKMALQTELTSLSPDPKYQALLTHYSIKFVGGRNSKNFQIIYLPEQSSQILKIENRLFNPKTVATELANSAIASSLTTTYADRLVTCIDPITQQQTTKNLLVSDYCSGGDLESMALRLKNDIPAKISMALTIYAQMAHILTLMQTAKAGFPDAKNQNWLIDSLQSLKIKIDDKKSLQPVGDNNIISVPQNNLKFYHRLDSIFMYAPETHSQTQFDVDKMHAFLLGKNLYHFLTGCTHDYLINKLDSSELDFDSHAVFATPEGAFFKQLIQSLVQEDPAQRTMRMDQVAQELFQHEKNYMPKECKRLIEEIKLLDNQKGQELEANLVTLPIDNIQELIIFRLKLQQEFEQLNLNNLKQECLALANLYYKCASNPFVAKDEYIKNNIDAPNLQYHQLAVTKYALLKEFSNAQQLLTSLIDDSAYYIKKIKNIDPTQSATDYDNFLKNNDLTQFKNITYKDEVKMQALFKTINALNPIYENLYQQFKVLEKNNNKGVAKQSFMTLRQECLDLLEKLLNTNQYPHRIPDKEQLIKDNLDTPFESYVNPDNAVMHLDIFKQNLKIRLHEVEIKRKIMKAYTDLQKIRPLTPTETNDLNNLNRETGIDHLNNHLTQIQLDLNTAISAQKTRAYKLGVLQEPKKDPPPNLEPGKK